MSFSFWSLALIATVAIVGCNSGHGVGTPVKAASPATAPVGAQAYYQWLTGCLGDLDKDVPRITRCAQTAAKLYVNDGYEIGAYGGDPFVREIFGRSGGLMSMLSLEKLFTPDKLVLPAEAIALVGLREDRIDEIAGKIVEFKKQGYYVVAFGRRELLDKARNAGASADDEIDTHASPHGGLFRDADGRWVIPTDSVAASAASWVWVGEFVAACTRLGKMPPMYMGYAVEGAKEREAKYKGMKFHDRLYSEIPAGQLGRQFLREAGKSLQAIDDSEMVHIRQVAAETLKARSAGGKLWCHLQGHSTLNLMGYPHDPRWFEAIQRSWGTMRKDVTISKGDFVLCIGFDRVFDGKDFQDFATRARKAGATLAWSITDYRPEQIQAIPPGEILINQHWAKGDAVADIPNYDIKCLPTSGVIGEAVLWMVHAEMLKLQPQTAGK